MSSSSRRKRKPDQTFKYVQQEDEAKGTKKAETTDKDVENASSSKEPQKGGGESSSESESNSKGEPPPKKREKDAADNGKGEGEAEEDKTNDESKEPYHFLSEADKQLLQTDMIEFLSRFAPKFYVPVYKTWTIPKTT